METRTSYFRGDPATIRVQVHSNNGINWAAISFGDFPNVVAVDIFRDTDLEALNVLHELALACQKAILDFPRLTPKESPPQPGTVEG